jgi:hypothetical protein
MPISLLQKRHLVEKHLLGVFSKCRKDYSTRAVDTQRQCVEMPSFVEASRQIERSAQYTPALFLHSTPHFRRPRLGQ